MFCSASPLPSLHKILPVIYGTNTQLVTEVIMAGNQANIPYSHSHTSWGFQPQFDDQGSEVISWYNTAFKAWQQSPSEASHSPHTSARNNAKSVLWSSKYNFLKRKCVEISSSNSDSSLWSLAKNIPHNFCQSSSPPVFHADGTVALTTFLHFCWRWFQHSYPSCFF